MHFAHRDNHLSVWRYLFAALLLLFAQLATIVHASAHEFHEHTEACDVFHHADKQQGNAQLGSGLTLLVDTQNLINSEPLVNGPVETVAGHYHQRAPPHS